MKKIYDSRVFWMIMSLLASLAIWVYMTSLKADEIKLTFRGVNVELVGENTLRSGKNMVVTDLDNATVSVDITGPRRIVAALESDKLTACVDVSKLSRSAYTTQQYYITFPDGVDTSDLSVSRKVPDTISFVVSQLNTKTVQVRGSFDGSLAEGNTAEAPVFEPSTITVSGPDSYLRNVSYAWVSFSKENVDSTYEVETSYTLMNEQGEECSTTGLTCSTDVIIATLPLLQVKEIPITVELLEGAGAARENGNIHLEIEPTSVTLAGDSAILSGMNKIVLDTIDLTDFGSTYTETYAIPIPNDLKNLTGAIEANVSVELTGLETKKFTVRNIALRGVSDGYEAEIVTEAIEVMVRGTPEQLNLVKPENIRAVADLTDFRESTGNYSPAVKIAVDGFTDVGAIGGPYTISVNIKKVS